MKTTQLEKDIAFCIDELDLSNEQIGEILRACEQLGNISVEYFCEEFIFGARESDTQDYDPEEINRLHDSDYLSIAEFNNLHWRSH